MVGKILMMCFSQSLDRVIGKCSKTIQRGENHYSPERRIPAVKTVAGASFGSGTGLRRHRDLVGFGGLMLIPTIPRSAGPSGDPEFSWVGGSDISGQIYPPHCLFFCSSKNSNAEFIWWLSDRLIILHRLVHSSPALNQMSWLQLDPCHALGSASAHVVHCMYSVWRTHEKSTGEYKTNACTKVKIRVLNRTLCASSYVWTGFPGDLRFNCVMNFQYIANKSPEPIMPQRNFNMLGMIHTQPLHGGSIATVYQITPWWS
jgi:hypothetical protein